MLSNAISTAWITNPRTKTCPWGPGNQRERKGRRSDAAAHANLTMGGTDEDQTDQRVRRRPGEGPALLYRCDGLREEDRLQPGAVSLAHGGLSRGAGRHRAAACAEQNPGGQGVSTDAVSTESARGHVLH